MKLPALSPWALFALPVVYSLPQTIPSPHDHRVSQLLKRHEGPDCQKSTNSEHLYDTQFDGVTWDEENWVLTTTNLDQGHYQSRGSVANGYLGINVASVGPFFELDREANGDVINGWPLFSRRQTFATIAGFYDSQPTTNGTNFPWLYQYGWDTAISGVPHWSGLILDLGDNVYLDSTVENKTISNFTSAYDFKAGVLSWSYTWSPPDKGSYAITYRLFANKLNITQAVVDLEIVPSVAGEATVANVLDGYSAVRTDFVESGEDDGALFSAVRPWGIPDVTAYIYTNLTGSKNVDLSSRARSTDEPYLHTNDSSIAQTVKVTFAANEPVHITKYVGGASTDAFPDPRATAKAAVSAAATAGYAASLKSHVTEWSTVMPDSSVDHFTDPATGKLPSDPHIIDAAIIAVTNIYYLLQNTVSQNAIAAVSHAPVNETSFSVGGLTSDSYAGQVFWDADVWMQPGLVASHPEAAQGVTNYRVAKYEQAKANVDTAFATSKNQTRFDADAAIYPWTSGRFGNCTATGPCFDYQYHLNGDIGLSMIYQWVASGDTDHFREKHFPIYDSVATLYSNLIERNGSSWTLTNMTDPDEYANHIDAGGFTMPLIGQTLSNANSFREQFDLAPNDTWTEMAEDVLMLRQNNVTLEYTTMNGTTVVKQADVVLVTYPLSYEGNYTTEMALGDLDYYANKQSPDGPAMTWSTFSIVASQVSPSGCSAYTYHQYAYEPYARAPFYQLSEQMSDNATSNGGTHPAYPFLTGHGGANQVVLFGYLGLRLLPDTTLHIDPNLPPQIPQIQYRTFYWRGWPISARSNYTHTTLWRDEHIPPLPTADKAYQTSPITVQVGDTIGPGPEPEAKNTIHSLPRTGPLTISNRMIGTIPTVPGNIVQCAPVTSPVEFENGQFPISAVDGATSTKWQPSSSRLSSVTVRLPDMHLEGDVVGFYFDWAAAPPVNASVLFHDDVLGDGLTFAFDGSQGLNDAYTIVTTLTAIEPSQVWTAEEANIVKMPVGNSTRVQLARSVAPARYATLLIAGNQALGADTEDTGATVAEWAILSQSDNQPDSSGTKRAVGVRDRAWLERLRRWIARR
ncbi:glycosyl hydrolase family 65 central catalytic domain-containing protein [Aspergillus avenaceus]|uniref:alpha,alpha-trehalase n=1 Tax=Aspergillus avenaceus TaxID=36643 RepID=A0A5N6TLW6_ASPAV|nr:glycosyl hydrolase family 65 central catalytic domain-containing protein [Aspergillus avenaceus]